MNLTDEYPRRFKNATAFKLIKSGGTYDVVPANPSTNRQLNIIDPGGTDDFVFAAASQNLSNKTLGSDLAAGGFKITGLANGTSTNDAVNLGQLQAHTAGIKPLKLPCRVATTANIALANTQTIDGVALSAGEYVLVKDQTDKSENGPWVVVAGGAWTRRPDFDGPEDIPETGLVFLFVSEGDTQANTGWLLTTDQPYTIGTDDLEFSQFNGGTSYVEGNGIDISGNVISAVGTSNRISVSGSGIDIAATYVGQTSITTVGTVGTGTWQGSAVGTSYGGTGGTSASAGFNNLSPVTSLGDLIIGTGTNTNGRLAGNIDAAKKFLNQTGTGSVSAAPTWSVLAGGDIPPIDLETIGSNGGITGVLDIGHGGTGQATAAAGLEALGGMPFYLPLTVTTNNNKTFVAGTDVIGFFSTGSSNRIAGLPTAGAPTKGQLFILQKIDNGSGIVTVTPSGCNINGVSTWPIETQFDGIWVVDDGANYWII